MKNLNEQISRIKDMMRQINEIEKYVPSIDSPEDEEEVENLYGHIYDDDDDEDDDETGYDPYKETNPFKTLKSDDFYDDKLKTTNYKERPKKIDIGNTPGNFKMTQSDGESGNNYFIDPYFEQDGKYIWNTDERKIDNIKNNIESIENAIDHLKERYNEFKENGEDFAKLSRIKDKIQTHEEKLIMYKDFLSQYS
jgi:uncharacterized protein with HEPN domain